MESEQLEILDFLQKYAPFTFLAPETLTDIAKTIDVKYVKRDTPILEYGQKVTEWYVVRSGAVEIYLRDGTLYNRMTEGGHFGESGLLTRGKIRYPATAIEDSLLYTIPEDVFLSAYENHEEFAESIVLESRSRLRQVVSKATQANELMSTHVKKLLNKEAVCTAPDTPIHAVAAHMSEQGVSSVLVRDDSGIVGIVTDRDIRNRAVAVCMNLTQPVSEIMTTDIVSVQHDRMAIEAMLTMLHHNVHHLPVLRRDEPVGVIALSDILRYESRNSLFVVSRIYHQETVDQLEELKTEVQATFSTMVNQESSSYMIGSAMAAIGRAYKQRLLELAHEKLGPAPIPYCFLALGSMARQEQLIVTDQDNALILDDSFDPARHDEYFKALATFVCDGLDKAGYPYCTGGVMATNDQWRQPLKVWREYFTQWIENPSPKSLLDSNIFFDLEGVYGQAEFAHNLQTLISQKARGNNRFLASMARNALQRTPPIGFFKNFVVEADGRHSRTINLKRRGTAPLTDLIRVHALAIGSRAHNSFERLNDIEQAKILAHGRTQDIRDALEFISSIRARNQAEQLAQEQVPSNSIVPDDLSDFDRKSLRDAFLILSNAQKYLRFRYQPNRSAH